MAPTKPQQVPVADHDNVLAMSKSTKGWYTKPHLLRLNYSILSLVLLSSSVGYDASCMNGLLALPTWNEFMNYPTGAWLGFINCAYVLGVLVALPLCPYVNNRYGRKMGIYVGYAFLIPGVIMQTCAQNEATFIASRAFIGINTAWYANSAPVLIAETAFPAHRGIATAFYNCGFNLGALVAAWVTFGTRNDPTSWSWRIPSVFQLAIPLVALPGILMSIESPRFLIGAGRKEEARAALVKAHAGGDATDELVRLETTEIETAIALEENAKEGTSYLSLAKGKGNRHRLLICVTLGFFSQWTGNGVVTYYLAIVLQTVGITSVTHQTLISACLSLSNLICSAAASLSIDRVGRRRLLLIASSVMLGAYVIITGLSGSFASSGHAATGVAVIPFLFIYFGAYNMGLNPMLYAYPSEIWPFALRTKGLNSAVWTSMLSLIFNIQVNPIGLSTIGWKYYIVFIVVLAIMLVVVYLAYPETKGYTLEQISVLFDGESAARIVEEVDRAQRKESSVRRSDTIGEEKRSRVEVTHA